MSEILNLICVYNYWRFESPNETNAANIARKLKRLGYKVDA